MYAKLVFRNAKRSVKDYLIYIVTMTICVTLFYSFLSISSRYYQPDIGSEYNFTILSDGMKAAICVITLFLLFLIRFVNHYMLRRKQKEFAVQSIMGMEQKTVGRLFFAETFMMGILSIAIGIFLGVFCSQFITAMLLTTYGKSYELSWTLFPDTVLLTIGFFIFSFLIVGIFNTRTIRKTKIIDMLAAEKENDPELKKSRWIAAVVLLFEGFTVWMLLTGVQKIVFYYDGRFAIPAKLMFWGNILFPAITLLWSGFWLIRKRKTGVSTLLPGLLVCTVLNTVMAASVPALTSRYCGVPVRLCFPLRRKAVGRVHVRQPKVVFHSLRHSSTTYKLKLNHGDLKATQGDTGHAQIDMITSVYAHILDEDRKINAQKFESAFYANPDLRSVRPPEEPKEPAPATLDLEALVEQLRKSPELANTLAALLASAPSEK